MSNLLADLALELISSAYGRGQDDAGPDDPRISLEARAIRAIRKDDMTEVMRVLAEMEGIAAKEWAEIERQYGNGT